MMRYCRQEKEKLAESEQNKKQRNTCNLVQATNDDGGISALRHFSTIFNLLQETAKGNMKKHLKTKGLRILNKKISSSIEWDFSPYLS